MWNSGVSRSENPMLLVNKVARPRVDPPRQMAKSGDLTSLGVDVGGRDNRYRASPLLEGGGLLLICFGYPVQRPFLFPFSPTTWACCNLTTTQTSTSTSLSSWRTRAQPGNDTPSSAPEADPASIIRPSPPTTAQPHASLLSAIPIRLA